MGLFSLFSSRKAADDSGMPNRAGRSGRNGRSVERDDPDDMLDPDFPQKQRARRRLIGAVLLVVLAVILLPLVFETEPRPVTEDVSVRMPGDNARGKPAQNDNRRATPRPAAQAAAQADNSQALDSGEEIVHAPPPAVAARPEPAPTTHADEKPAAKPSKFIILIGAFSSEERVKGWQTKLKGVKVPNYVERKTLADGERILLRAGPFNDRDAAEAAEKKVRGLGLTARLTEQ